MKKGVFPKNFLGTFDSNFDKDSPCQVFAVNYESPCIASADLAGFL